MTELKPCPFCGSPVHWDDGIIHDELRFNCIVDMVWPLESNMHIPKEMWIKKWNIRDGGMTELKPCPFCGGEPRIHDYGEGHCLIACSFCCARTHDDSLEEAIATWNRRVEE